MPGFPILHQLKCQNEKRHGCCSGWSSRRGDLLLLFDVRYRPVILRQTGKAFILFSVWDGSGPDNFTILAKRSDSYASQITVTIQVFQPDAFTFFKKRTICIF